MVILGTIVIIFLISHSLVHNVAALWAGPKAKPSTVHAVILRYHLNSPWYDQLYFFIAGIFTGNVGTDPVTGQAIMSEIFYYFPHTLELVLAALVIIILMGVGLGYLSAIHFGTKKDGLIRVAYTAAWATPTFLGSMIAILVFSTYLPILPSGSMYNPSLNPPVTITGIFVLDSLIEFNIPDFINGMYHLILPAFTLAILNFGLVSRISRSGILEVRWASHVKTAYSKGLDERSVRRKHILRNGLIESNTVIAVMFGWLISGTVVVEYLFSWPGIGQFAYNAISSVDYPVLIAVVVFFTIAVIIANLIADIIYAILDPRISLGGGES